MKRKIIVLLSILVLATTSFIACSGLGFNSDSDTNSDIVSSETLSDSDIGSGDESISESESIVDTDTDSDDSESIIDSEEPNHVCSIVYSITENPTLTKSGIATATCSDDDCDFSDEVVVPVLSDSDVWTVDVTSNSTCETAGEATYSSVYGDVTIDLPLANHSFDSVTVITAASCEADGSALLTCSVCSTTETKVISALGHDFSGDVVPYVMSSAVDESYSGTEYDGTEYHVVKCVRCGAVDADNKVAHSFADDPDEYFLTEPTSGWHAVNAKYSCSCGYAKTVSGDDDTDLRGYLEQTDYWTKSAETVADYNVAGSVTYTHNISGVVITIASNKLVAPYDGKTYTAYDLDKRNGGISTYAWGSKVSIGADGKGVGTAHPFANGGNETVNEITMVNASTGEISYMVGDTEYYGFVDFESGIIILANQMGTFAKALVLVPEGYGISLSGSSWSIAMVVANGVDCNYGVEHAFNWMISDDEVFFNVDLVDLDGNALSAADCASADYVAAISNGSKVLAFAKNSLGAFEYSDNLEGVYVNDTDRLVLSGAGAATLNNLNGVYAKVDGADYIDLFILDGDVRTAYYRITLGDGTFVSVKPTINASFVTELGDAPSDMALNLGVSNLLPSIDVVGNKVLRGWTIGDGEDLVTSYVPSLDATDDIVFTAVWAVRIEVTFNGVLGDEDTVTIILGAGDNLAEKAADYDYVAGSSNPTLDGKGNYFGGWYLDANGNGTIDDDESSVSLDISLDDLSAEVTFIAKWIEVPAYVGTYYGTEIYNRASGNYGNKTLTISLDGNISGVKTGTIVSYDEDTQKVTWTNGENQCSFYFHKEAKVILGLYKNNDILDDFYFFSQELEGSNGQTAGCYSFRAVQPGASTSYGYYAHLILSATALGDNTLVYTYDNKIYADVQIKNALGEELSVASTATTNAVADSATIVVYDNNGNVLLALAATEGKESFKAMEYSDNPRALDSNFGTYSSVGSNDLVVDGAGSFVWGDKSGSYSVASDNVLDAFVKVDGENAEFYVITLDKDAKSYSFKKPMVNVAFSSSILANEAFESTLIVNKNIAITLPVLTNDNNVFRGWIIDDSDPYNGTYVPAGDVAFVAKWDVKFTFKAVYNDGATEDLNAVYGEGDVVDVETPVLKGMKFEGWFSTSTFDEGTLWTSGSAISENLIVYAKWSQAEPYYNTYGIHEITGDNQHGVSSYYFRGTVSVDADGNANGSAYPFYGSYTIESYDKTAGTLVLNKFNGFIDPQTGIIVFEYKSSTNFNEVRVLSPFATSRVDTITSSYWNDGYTRAIEVDTDDGKIGIFVFNGRVYFDVSFSTALTDETAIAANECYIAPILYVIDKDGNLISKFGHDGTTMVAFDGNEGTYVDSVYGDVVIDGIKEISFGGHSGTYTVAADADHDIDAYMVEDGKAVYYRVTLDKDKSTCSVVKPMVTLSFDFSGVTPIEGVASSVDVNVNVEYSLPKLTNADKVFRGWYVSGDQSQKLVTSLVPVENVSYVAKWDDRITLTVVYGNGLDNVEVPYGVGDTLDLDSVIPAYANGKYFVKWCSDADCTVDFTDATISANTTIYALWEEGEMYEVSEKYYFNTVSSVGKGNFGYGFVYSEELNAWVSSNAMVGNSTATLKITARTKIIVSFSYSCGGEYNYDYMTIVKKCADGTVINIATKHSDGSTNPTVVELDEAIELAAGDSIEFVYSKDGSGNKGDDAAKIYNLTVNGEAFVHSTDSVE